MLLLAERVAVAERRQRDWSVEPDVARLAADVSLLASSIAARGDLVILDEFVQTYLLRISSVRCHHEVDLPD